MNQERMRLTVMERLFSRVTLVRPGEGRSVSLFFAYALLMMISYYILKTIREPLLLTGWSAEMKSYAYAATAGVLLVMVPLYGLVFRYTGKQQLTRYVTGFFVVNLLLFYLAGHAGLDIGFAYYVWVGVFAVMITAQFWAFAADSYNVRSGQRLFPAIMIGATLGGLLAPSLSGALFPVVGPWVLMLAATVLLVATLPFVGWSRAAIPPRSRGIAVVEGERAHGGVLGGLSLVARDRYLILLALLILLLNWVNTTGEYILAELVVRHADTQAAAGSGIARADFIAAFYGNFFFAVNLLTLLAQVFVVARVIQAIGVGGAILILPLVTLAGYGLVAFIPVFSLIRVFKMIENSTDYSLMNTARHALYLPLSTAQKYEGKTAIETFFWRFGDLAQAGAIYAGLNWLHFDIPGFAAVNMVLSAIWLMVAWRLSKHYRVRAKAASAQHLPRLLHSLEPRSLAPGMQFAFELSIDTFDATAPGDALRFAAREQGSDRLPPWLTFDAEGVAFSGTAPAQPGQETVVLLRATDHNGSWAEGQLVLKVGEPPDKPAGRSWPVS